ncbi:unnamed protein product [Closterium sp. Yama58-4]|nr:unnamed protein product [Closterium sp. Yama58-4]
MMHAAAPPPPLSTPLEFVRNVAKRAHLFPSSHLHLHLFPSSPLHLFPSSPLPLFPSFPLPSSSPLPSSPLPLFPSSPLPLFPSSPLPLFPSSLPSNPLPQPDAGDDMGSTSSTSSFDSTEFVRKIAVASPSPNSSNQPTAFPTGTFWEGARMGRYNRGQLFGCLVAIKKLEQGSDQGPAEFRTEVEVLSKVRHPHIVLLMGHCPEEACIVYEFLQGGNLQERIVRAGDNPPPPLPWHDRIRIVSEISGALLYMHRHDPPILHRDLKPDNILLDANSISKIADVGLARLIPNEVSAVTWKVRGTAGYIDPEELQTGELSVKSDIYAFGLIALQLLTGLKNVKLVHGLLAACGTGARNTEEATDLVMRSLDRSAGKWPERLVRRATRVLVRCIERRRVNRPDLGVEIHPLLGEIAEEAMEEKNRRLRSLTGGLSARCRM